MMKYLKDSKESRWRSFLKRVSKGIYNYYNIKHKEDKVKKISF